jgi:chromosomal replication initiation ATPase DnaA
MSNIEIVARYLNLSPEFILSKTRKAEVVYARKLIIHAELMNKKTLQSIADMLNLKNHATIIHHRNKLKDISECYKDVRADVKNIEKLVIPELVIFNTEK